MPVLPDSVQSLIFLMIPTIDALEILVFLARHPARHFTTQDVIDQLRPTEVAESRVRESLALFRAHGIIALGDDGMVVFEPASVGLREAVAALVREYHERPVTLIRTMHDIADRKAIQSFADAFRLMGDRP